MEEKIKNSSNFSEVNLKRLGDALLRKVWLIILAAIAGAAIVLTATYFLVTPKYESSAMFYVNNNSISVGEATLSIDSSDITASKSLVNTYIVILNTRETLNDVIDYAGVNRRYSEVEDMIRAESVDDTEVFQVVVTTEDPEEANVIANAIAYILPKRISSIVEGTSAKVVEAAVVSATPSSPSYTMNTLIGFLLGFVLAVGVIVMQEMLDVTIRKDEDLTIVCKHPVLASVPDMNAPTKGSGTYYGYGVKRSKKKKRGNYASAKNSAQPVAVMGGQLSFAASEAYKLLRTKLQFSFSDENDCHVIGISSALSGEGKSLTSVNLAYTLSQLDKKVLLIDCDMRRPTLAEKLGILKTPGLSSYLTRQCSLEDLVQVCSMKGSENTFQVITAGQNPPNPIELLSSERMKAALRSMRKTFDYIILDLPPVGEVSDAMAVAKDTDGILLVVRQNYCDRISLSEAVRQFDFIQSKILGVVLNCASEHSGNYSKGYYKRYYRRYYNRYYNRYENNSRAISEGKNGKAAK